MYKTFSLSITENEEFWKNVIYVEEWHSSGLGGPGALWIITSEKLLYQIGFEVFPYDEYHLERFNKFFEKERYDRERFISIYKIEANGWKYLPSQEFGEDIWIRQEYAEKFEKQYKKRQKDSLFVFGPQVFAEMLGVEGDIERVYEEKLVEFWRRRKLEEDRQEKE